MIRDLLQESYDAMRHNRRRTALTMLGMAWGIATVVMLLAYGDGFGRACANIFANFGTKLIIVVPGRSSMQSGGEKAGAQTRITLDDVDLLSTNIPQITHITPSCNKSATMQYDTRSYTMNVNGEYPNTFAIRALTWRRDASTIPRIRSSARASPSSAPKPKKNFSPDATPWASTFASTASALKSSAFSAPRCRLATTILIASSTSPSPP
jgi:hypothetical protein